MKYDGELFPFQKNDIYSWREEKKNKYSVNDRLWSQTRLLNRWSWSITQLSRYCGTHESTESLHPHMNMSRLKQILKAFLEISLELDSAQQNTLKHLVM